MQLEASDERSQHFPAEGATVYFDSNMAGVRSIFRASVDSPSGTPAERPRAFTLTVSLSSASALMRAALLRRVGYQLSNPKLYHSLTVKFADLAARDKFLDDLADGSLSSRKRWIRGGEAGAPKDRPEVTLQGVVLEPGRINVQTVHWGLISQQLQQDRRVFRGLVVPDVLLDYNEKVNAFAWDPARIFNGAINFDYLYSEGFADVAYDDAKWIMARIARLTREDFRGMVALAGLPDDVSRLLVEKIISRRNALAKLFGLADEFGVLPFDSRLSVGNVVQGQLVRDDYKGYPEEFYAKPDKPPLRFSQLWRYAAIETISGGIGALLSVINTKLLTLASSGTVTADHQKAVSEGMAKYLMKTGSLTGFQQTSGLWGAPIGGANLSASRTVVAGTYLGSDSQVQMVDTMSVSLNAGYFLGWDGAAPIAAPGVASTVALSRSYSHVRPVQDMNTALKTHWGRLVTVGFMKHLARALNPDIRCSIPEGPWTSEVEVGGVKFTKIHYDDKRPHGKEEALTLRATLIAGGADSNKIILQPDDREADCKVDVEKSVDKNLAAFADDLAVGETFVITDAVQFGLREQVNIPIPVLAGAVDLSVAPNANQGYLIQRQTILKKVEGGFQVYLQDNRLESSSFGLDFNFYVNVFKASRETRRGHATADFYNIPTADADVTVKQKLIRSLKALLRSNNAEILTDSFDPYTLKQDLMAKLFKFKFLLWSKVNAIQNLSVDIYPPVVEGSGHDRKDYKRTLSMNRMVTRRGTDWFGFMMDGVSRVSGGLVQLPGLGGVGAGDPGNSPGGKSWTGVISTQAETTPGAVFRPVTAVQQTYRGWLISRGDVFKIFDRVEGVYGSLLTPRGPNIRGLFDRTQFNNTSRLELYQIDTTLMFYPEALERVRGWIQSPDERALFKWLLHLYGDRKARTYCAAAEAQYGRRGAQIYHGQGFSACAPDWMHSLLRMRREGLPRATEGAALLAWYNSMMSYLMNNTDPTLLMAQLDPKHYFFVTRVNGFRKNDATGSLDGYLSDTVGHYDSERGLGIFRDFSSQYGISLFQLYAQFFTDGL